jgi:hypothetical protein
MIIPSHQRNIEFEEELAEKFSGGTTNARNKETTSHDEDEGGDTIKLFRTYERNMRRNWLHRVMRLDEHFFFLLYILQFF